MTGLNCQGLTQPQKSPHPPRFAWSPLPGGERWAPLLPQALSLSLPPGRGDRHSRWVGASGYPRNVFAAIEAGFISIEKPGRVGGM
jgi:hypothetical protein